MRKQKLSPEMKYTEWTDYWMENTKENREETTNAKYREVLESILIPAMGERELGKMTEEMILSYLEEEMENGRSIARLNTMLTVLRGSMESAVKHRLILHNPCANIRLPRRIRRENAILTDEDLRKLIEKYGDHCCMPLILIMLFLGLRAGEALGLDWEKVDLEEKSIRIDSQAVEYWEDGRTKRKRKNHTKNRVERVLPLCDAAWECLKGLKEGSSGEGPVFTDKEGKRIGYQHFYYEFRKMMAAIGREDIHPHSLRHTAASTLLYETGDLILVRDFLGHRSIRSSEQYPEATEEEKQKAADALDQYFYPYLLEVFGEEALKAVGLERKEGA